MGQLTAESVAVTIGEQCRTVPADVQELWLGIDKPAWFDGTHLYKPTGKYVAHQCKNGNWRLRRIHNLSAYGLLNWFEPCEFVSYNSLMMGAYETQQEAAARLREQNMAQQAREAEDRAEAARRAESMFNKIEEILACHPVAKRATVKCGELVADGYGDWCIYRTGDKKRPYQVAHVQSEIVARSFQCKGHAIKLIQFLSIYAAAGCKVRHAEASLIEFGARACQYIQGDRSEEVAAHLLVLLVDLHAKTAS